MCVESMKLQMESIRGILITLTDRKNAGNECAGLFHRKGRKLILFFQNFSLLF